MKACIRRGANQIGGSAVELESQGARIIIDLGLPLDAEVNTPDLLPVIAGLNPKTDDLLGLVVSHPHQDHSALGFHIDPAIPVYMGAAASRIMKVPVEFNLPNAFAFENVREMEGFKHFTLGPFKITPYPVDHSAYDAYALMIEADERRVFYSGDFRAHGRTSKRVEHLLENPPCNVDVLMMEGTSMGRSEEAFESETDLEAKFTDAFREAKGLVVVQTSSQNIDRVVTVYRACKRTKRTLVMSGYTGRIMMVTENENLPNFRWPDVRKFADNHDKSHHVTVEDIAASPNKYVVILINKITSALESCGMLGGALLIYSMSKGYKEKHKTLRAKFAEVIDDGFHTSGHADIPTLKRLVEAIEPKRLIPIHTFEPERFEKLFANEKTKVEIHPDNETFKV